MRSIITIVALILVAAIPQAMAQNKKVDKALTYFNSGEYTKCSEMLVKLYPKTKDRPTKGKICFYLGECARKTSDPRNAERWYKKAVQAKYSNPLATLYLADALKMRGNYEDASATYSSYIDLVPDDKRGEQGVKDCETALQWEKKPTRYIVYPARWLNDKESDFAPAFGTDSTEIFYTSARESATGNERNANSGMYYTDIFYSKRDKKGKWSIPIPAEGAINTNFDEGSTLRGRLSPVSALVFRLEEPSTTTPSSGTFSPGWTTMMLPTSTSSGSTCSSSPSTSILA